jgi:thioredoxin 1
LSLWYTLPMANSKHVLTATDGTFQTEIVNAKGVAIVDFWAEWCGPCKMLGPTIDALADEYAGKAKIYKLNVDDNPEAGQQLGIKGIPTVIVFKDGKIVDRLVGLQPKEVLSQAIQKQLS